MRWPDSTAPSAQPIRRRAVCLQSRQVGGQAPRWNQSALLADAQELVGRLHLLVWR